MNTLARVHGWPLLRWLRVPALMLAVALAGLGCRTVDPGLKSVMSIGYAVDGAMRGAAGLYHAGKLTDADKDKIIALHRVWLPVYSAALELAIAERDAAPSPELARRTADLLTAATAAGIVTRTLPPK